MATTTSSDIQRFVHSSLVYGAVALPALWLLGGSRGLQLVGASAAVGAAVTALHAGTGVQSLVAFERVPCTP